ncbi:MAG: methyltransferase domain-containing protein [Balneolaceae bacterium]
MKNPNSHLTAKERDKVSYPTRRLYNMGVISGDVLDYGSGFGKDVEFLKSRNISCSGYDPHYAPDYPAKRFDTIICNYVLNVLLPEEQAEVLMSVSELLKPEGKAYFSVRRDLKYYGYRTHRVHKLKTYQCNVKLPFKSILKNEFCEIYEYRHFNQTDNDKKEFLKTLHRKQN